MADPTECLMAGAKVNDMFNKVLNDGYIDHSVINSLRSAVKACNGCVKDSKHNKFAIADVMKELQTADRLDGLGNVTEALQHVLGANTSWLAVK